jgi:glutathionyl-hydroquinone reductase
VSLACPWAHRTLIFRALQGLEDVISVSTVHPHMLENGWEFRSCEAGDFTAGDPLFGQRLSLRGLPARQVRLHRPCHRACAVGQAAQRHRQQRIRRHHPDAEQCLRGPRGSRTPTIYPAGAARGHRCEVNARVYKQVNNGVYRCGFATTQKAYEKGLPPSCSRRSTGWMSGLAQRVRYLVGDRITEADWRLFTTLVRFDPVYVGHFKANKRRIRRLSEPVQASPANSTSVPGVAPTVHFGPDQAALLLQPPHDQSRRAWYPSGRNSTSTHRTGSQ